MAPKFSKPRSELTSMAHMVPPKSVASTAKGSEQDKDDAPPSSSQNKQGYTQPDSSNDDDVGSNDDDEICDDGHGVDQMEETMVMTATMKMMAAMMKMAVKVPKKRSRYVRSVASIS